LDEGVDWIHLAQIQNMEIKLWISDRRIIAQSSPHSMDLVEYTTFSYNKSQQDALFLKFILIKNSACFGQIYCPSSGASTLNTQQ